MSGIAGRRNKRVRVGTGPTESTLAAGELPPTEENELTTTHSYFEPDATTLKLLQAEHINGTWVGRELLPIACRIRNAGGTEDDYTRWVKSSNLWLSYTCSTSDPVGAHQKHLESAWDKSEESKPFELDDALADLEDRIRAARWDGRAGRRNQTVALAFVGYCRDRNCFTRTLSRYELAKHTPGISPDTVGKGLQDLVKLGLLDKVDRSDLRSSSRSASRYSINLFWNMTARLQGSQSCNPNGISKSRSTAKSSLTYFCHIDGEVRELDLSTHDLWTYRGRNYRGLGQSALRVWTLLPDHPGSDAMSLDDPSSVYDDDSINAVGKSSAELVTETGLSRRTVDTALKRLFDNCLAVELPGRPHRWLRAAYPPVEAIAAATGCAGALDDHLERIERRQHANRIAYAGSYARNPHSQKATTTAA